MLIGIAFGRSWSKVCQVLLSLFFVSRGKIQIENMNEGRRQTTMMFFSLLSVLSTVYTRHGAAGRKGR